MPFNFKSYTSNNPLLKEVDEEVTVSSSGVEMGQNSQDIDIWQMAGDHLEDFRSELASAHAMASQSGQKEWVSALNKIALRLDALESAMAEANAKLGVLPMK
jgi:archaellum component FlaC